MLLHNTTPYHTDAVRRIIKFAANLIPIDNIGINVKNTRGRRFYGRAYRTVPWQSNWHRRRRRAAKRQARYLVVCALGGGQDLLKRYPMTVEKKGPYFAWHFETWQECLVHLAAHELYHIVQYRGGCRAVESECELYALRRLEAWRLAEAKSTRPVGQKETI